MTTKKKFHPMRRLEPYLYLLPSILVISAFLFYPMLDSLRLSFTDWNGLKEVSYIGFSNYDKIFHNNEFWNSIWVTIVWVVLSVVILPLTGLLYGVMVEYLSPNRTTSGIFRTILFMPMMMSYVAIGLLWQLVYDPNLGLINSFLSLFGMIDPVNPIQYLSNSNMALFWAFIPVIWQWSGFGMVMTCAAMMNIPHDIIEAAALPLLMPTVLTGSAINLIGGFKAFDIIYVMTQGGPGSATKVTSILMYRLAFTENRFGYACAMAVIVFLLALILTGLFNKFRSSVDRSVGNI
mgnify:CR=1 FL=1